MTSIVTSTYRYKRPPRKRKAVVLDRAAAEDKDRLPPAITTGWRAQSSTPREVKRVISIPHHSPAA
jgi:hypothetical protein